MNKKLLSGIILSLLLLTITSFSALAGTQQDKSEEQLLATSKVNLLQAINLALQEVSGTAVSAELDDELKSPVYVVEVFAGDGQHKITVDRMTGQILNNKLKSADDDGDEEERD